MRHPPRIGPLIPVREGVPRRHLSGHLFTFLAWLGITIIAAFLNPSPHAHGTHQQLGLPPCGSVFLFHRPCPGCGLTTSFTATVHGQFLGAFRAHWLGPIIYLAFTAWAFMGLYGFLTKRYFDTGSAKFTFALKWFMIMFLTYGIIRFFVVRLDPQVEPLIFGLSASEFGQAPH